jgi:hypothetical protein
MANPVEQYPRSPYNDFRRPTEPGLGSELITSVRPGYISKRFDEPTYLTFRIKFDYDNVNVDNTDFDKFPMPLFNKYQEDKLEARNQYSTYQYLRDSNEVVRSYMMLDFINGWKKIENEYQWYFQEIAGLDSILSVDPLRGMRVSPEGRITVKMLEAMDLRITHLLDIYKKIAWDDTYQRWILPDMMRYFKMQIYVTEFRSFHQSSIVSRPSPGQAESPLILELINNFSPVYVLEFDRCEFDITSIKKIPDTLSATEAQMREVDFSIKVGNMSERYINPILNFFYYDLITNGFDRTNDTEIVENEFGSVDLPINPTSLSDTLNPNMNPVLSDYAKGDALANSDHESGRPFIQSGYLNNIANSSPNYDINVSSVDPIDPATWTGNAITLGKSLVKNLIKSKVDEIKVSKIPGLGISLNEAIAAIQSKNVFTLFGAARRALNDTVAKTLPSQELESNLVDTQFRDFLLGISQSEATDPDALELKGAANIVLNDRGQWEKIKDLSMATDLLSTALGEINSARSIENRNGLKSAYGQPYVPLEVKDLLVFEGLPSSTSTQSRSLEGQKINRPLPSQATLPPAKQIERGQTTGLGSSDGNLTATGSLIAPSSQLGNDAGERGVDVATGLGSSADGAMTTAKPSEQLGSSAEGGMIQPILSDSKIEGDKIYLPESGEAVDGDPITGKALPRPLPSQATNSKIE